MEKYNYFVNIKTVRNGELSTELTIPCSSKEDADKLYGEKIKNIIWKNISEDRENNIDMRITGNMNDKVFFISFKFFDDNYSIRIAIEKRLA